MSVSEIPESSNFLTETQSDKPVVRIPRPNRKKSGRRNDILQTLVKLLEDPRCDRVTTALIAQKLDISEAALYRNFSSKAMMFDALITFVETSLMDLFAQIKEDKTLSALGRVQVMTSVMLDFADANRGLTRVMTGQALMKEDSRLTERMTQLVAKFEMTLRQELREAILAREVPADFDAAARANLLINWVLGRWLRFVMSGFQVRPNGISALTIAPLLKP